MSDLLNELSVVALTRDLPDERLAAGDVGTIVLVHPPAGYTVEFVAFDGETIAIVDVPADAVRPVARGEIKHARAVA